MVALFFDFALPMHTHLVKLLVSADYQKLRYRSAFLLYLMILIWGSVPGAREEIGYVASGVVLHSIAYGGLTFLLFSGRTGAPLWRAATALATIALMGAFDELLQSFMPFRHGALTDWLVDCNAGLIMSALLWAFWAKAERAYQA
ncbi:VanZ family protein [Janthinobacterium sp. CG3]|uniref:VanZ family protein n=1 Tax=Janthinobacterium sp. CG3 TaxID=1075768 RepID=UPI001E2B2DDF|nr:VanZ family protein [Janthinobacterium sp. CG3]